MSPMDGDRVGASRELDEGIKGRQDSRKQNTQLPIRLQPEADANTIYHHLNMS